MTAISVDFGVTFRGDMACDDGAIASRDGLRVDGSAGTVTILG